MQTQYLIQKHLASHNAGSITASLSLRVEENIPVKRANLGLAPGTPCSFNASFE